MSDNHFCIAPTFVKDKYIRERYCWNSWENAFLEESLGPENEINEPKAAIKPPD